MLLRIVFIPTLALILTSGFTQSRKSLLKEINNYREHIYKTAQYNTTQQQLSFMLRNYFANDGFNQNNETDSLLLTFTKKGYLTCNMADPNFNNSNPGGTIEKCKVTFYVTIELASLHGLKKIGISSWAEEYNQPFTRDFSQKSIIGTYKFNENGLYKYLYQQIVSKEKIILSESLLSKIENYNNHHNNPEKKLLENIDY